MQAQAQSPFEHPLARVAFIVSLSFHNSTGLPPLQDYDPGKYGAFNVYLRSWRPLSELTRAVFSLAIYLGLALSFYIVLLGSLFFQQLVWHWKESRACNLNQPMPTEYSDYLIQFFGSCLRRLRSLLGRGHLLQGAVLKNTVAGRLKTAPTITPHLVQLCLHHSPSSTGERAHPKNRQGPFKPSALI